MKKGRIIFIFLIIIFLNLPVQAQTTGEVNIHGLGGWGYGHTDGNNYASGTENGEYNYYNFALNISAFPQKNLSIHSQAWWESGEEGLDVELDFVFAEWAFSDVFKFRIGKVKHPFGIYTEVYDLGTVRPFFFLPQGIYGPVGIIAESFLGGGLSGSYFLNDNWGISYDLYGGEIQFESPHPWHVLAIQENSPSANDDLKEEEEGYMRIKEIVGIRMVFATPVDGLSFGFSGLLGKPEHAHFVAGEGATKKTDWGFHKSFGFHAEYLSDKFWMRSEVARHEHKDREMISAAYSELSYKLTDSWQVAVRYDWLNTEIPATFDISEAPSMIEHKDFAMGLNYWFSSNFVLKLSYHTVDGNRFALPENLVETIEKHELNTKTRLIFIGSQFSF